MPAAKKKAARAAAPAKKAVKATKPKASKPKAAKPKAAAPQPAKAQKAKSPKAAAAPTADKARKVDAADKAKKPKLVRDSYTIPKNEYTVLADLKLRASKLGRPARKSEVLRAGVIALAGMGDAAFLATVSGVPALKTGRPAKSIV